MNGLTLSLLLAAAAAVVAWTVLRRRPRPERIDGPAARAGSSPGADGAATQGIRLPAPGYFAVGVVGDAERQDLLRTLVGEHHEAGADFDCIAQFVPPAGRPPVIPVRIMGETVGHLTGAAAERLTERLERQGLAGQITTCDAAIVGGGVDRRGQPQPYAVRLDIEPLA